MKYRILREKILHCTISVIADRKNVKWENFVWNKVQRYRRKKGEG
jgi:hypothetical protein